MYSETPTVAIPTLGECHTAVPSGGITLTITAGHTGRVSLISARYGNMDEGAHGSNADVLALARAAYSSANVSSAAAVLFAEHERAMDELHEPGIDVEGNRELASVVNASMHALLGIIQVAQVTQVMHKACKKIMWREILSFLL